MSRLHVATAAVAAQGTAGFLKRCLWFRFVAVYRDQGVWHCQIGSHRWRLDDDHLKVVVTPSAFGRVIEFSAPGFRRRCWISDIGDSVARRLDAAYDYTDRTASDFPRWLAECRQEARGVRAS